MSLSNRIAVLFCFDDIFANYAAVATYSAHKNTKSPISFYWLFTPECEDKAIKLISQLKQFDIQIKPLSFDLSQINYLKIKNNRFTKAVYLRLFAADLIVNEDKVIYIDCDTLILADLKDLYDIQLNDMLIGGVNDEMIVYPKRSKKFLAVDKIPRTSGDIYINSGVLLMNLKGLREDGFLRKTKIIAEFYGNRSRYHDQCLINKYAEGKKLILDPK